MLENYSLLEMAAFAVIIVVALLVDLHAHKADKPVSMRSAALWSMFWVGISLAFAFYISTSHGPEHGALFLAGYLLEKSLSVDNLFVFMAIFASFSIKDAFQHRVLYYGIIGALVLRIVFVAIGTSLLAFGKWALIGFGAFVLWSAWKMWVQSRQEHEEIVDYSQHWSVRLATKFFPVYPKIDNHNFFTRQDSILCCTPLFLCLIVIEVADVMFAFDSVPAVIAVTREPFLVYTSNIFAVLGLRSLYFLLAAAKRFLVHLEKAVIAILAFIGFKMLLDAFGVFHIAPMLSLAVVGGLLVLGIVASVVIPGDGAKNADAEPAEQTADAPEAESAQEEDAVQPAEAPAIDENDPKQK